MIIDVHCHLWGEGVPSAAWWEDFCAVSASLANRPVEKVKAKLPGWWDLTGNVLVQDMDEAGIDKSVVLLMDTPLFAGTGDVVSLDKQHQIYADAARKHPDRIIAFGGIHPQRPHAAQYVERMVKEWGMKGLKLHPSYGPYYLNDPACYLVYAKCQELGIPVLVHTGQEPFPTHSKYGDVMCIDDVAADFPDLKIILAHAAQDDWHRASIIASNNLNVYIDLSFWQMSLLHYPIEELYKPLRSMFDIAGVSRVLFGSDWPGLRQVRRLGPKVWVDAFRNPPWEQIRAAGIDFTEEEMNAFLGGNAAKVLGL